MSSAIEQEKTIFDALSEHFDDRSREAGMEYTQLAKRSLDKAIEGDMIHSPLKKGAVVISVDGEGDDEQASMEFEKISYLGRFVGMKMVNPHYYRLYFTTRNGYYYEGTKNLRQKLIQHPLSSRGYLVPARDGLKVLDKGNVVLVSRNGVFSQLEGYKRAEKFQREALKNRQRAEHYMSLHEETIIKLETVQDEVDNVYLRNVSLSEQLREISTIKAEMSRAKEKAEGMVRNLKSKAEYSQDVLEHNRRMLEEEMSKFSRYVSDILMTIERQEVEDSYRAMRSTHPTLTKDFEKQLLNKWEREGIAKANEVKILERRLDEYQNKLRRKEEDEAYDEVSGYPEEGSGGTGTDSDGTDDSGGSEGMEKGGNQGSGDEGRSGLSNIVSRAKEIPDRTVNALAELKARASRNKTEEVQQDEEGLSEGDE